MPAYTNGDYDFQNGMPSVDPFYPDGYISTNQDRQQIIAQKEKYNSPNGGINFKFPLRAENYGFFQSNKTTIAAVREDIKTLLMTVKGERVMHKEMGTNIPVLSGQLFEPIHRVELLEKIRMEINVAIENYLPFISLQDVVLATSEEADTLKVNQVRVSMAYIIKDQQAMGDTLTFTVTST